jgi:hypothetical protein
MLGGQDGPKPGSLDPRVTHHAGVVPRAVHELFTLLNDKTAAEGGKCQVVCSYMEIYNDRLFDLLQPVKKGATK